MGFFDFMTNPLKLGGKDDPNDMETRRAKAISEQKPKLETLDQRNSYMSQIADLRDKVATEIAQAQLAKSGIRSNDYSLLKEAVLKRVPADDYGAVARNLEKHARGIGPAGGIDPSTLPSFLKLQEAVRGFKQQSLSQPVKQTQAGVSQQLAQTDLPNIDRKIQSVKEQLAKLPEQKVYSSSDAEDKTIAKQEKVLTSYLQALNQQKMQVQGKLGQKQPVAGAPVRPSSNDSPRKGFESAGVDGKNQAQGVNDAEDEFKRAFGENFSFDGPVAFAPGLQHAIKILDPSGQLEQEMAAWAASTKSPEMTVPEAPKGGGMMGPPEAPSSKAAKQPTDTEMELSRNREERRQAAQELADAEEMQSWPAIISFVLLSLAIGPQLAFVFFSNAKKKGVLKNEIALIDEERKALREQQTFERNQQAETRQMVANNMMMRQGAKEDIALKMYAKIQVNWVKASKKAVTDEEKKYLKNLVGMFSRKMQLAKQAQFSMNEELANKYFEEAQDISDELDGIAAGDAGAEEDGDDLDAVVSGKPKR